MIDAQFARAPARWILALVLALGVPGSAWATAMFEYRAYCELECQNIGLNLGDPVGGLIGISDAAMANGGVTSLADVESFSIDFGVFHFDLPSLGAASATLSGAHDEGLAFQFVTSAPGGSAGFAFAQTNWIAGNSVWEAAYGGHGTLLRVVPEPPPWMLVAMVLVPLLARRAFVRRG